MTKIHLLYKKEEITPEIMDEDKVAVVFDVLLATSTITACLAHGAKQVIPVLDEAEAISEAKKFPEEDVCLAGELDGFTIEGFLDPLSLSLRNYVSGKHVVLSTTNGTVAIRRAAGGKAVYIASLLNSNAVARRIYEKYRDRTIVIVCSGSKDQFCLEDFYGAGYFISQLKELFTGGDVELADSALAADLFYRNMAESAEDVLSKSQVGRMLNKYGLRDEIRLVSEPDKYSVVPYLAGEKAIELEGTGMVAKKQT